MTSQQIKSYVALRHADQITRFEAVNNEQIVRAYQFTDQLRSAAARLLSAVASGTGASAIVGERGTGKSHLLALVRSLANQPELASTFDDYEASVAIQEIAAQKIPTEGIPTLTIGFDPNKGLNFLKAFPKAPGLEGELPAWLSTDQIDELIEKHISSSDRFALFIDGISPLLKHPENGGALLQWLQYLAPEAAAGRFSLVLTLDQEIVDRGDMLAEELCSLCQLERISIATLATLIDQAIFRKTQQQYMMLEALYSDLRSRMPHFTGRVDEFVQLYPVHPVVLQLSPAMRRYSRTFSLFGFITAVAARALVRRAFSLICLDDLFESFEFDLRKNPNLTETFAVYDHLFNSVVPNLGQQHSLYAKMMIKGLLLLSLAGRASTAAELADAVMLYDDREPKTFRKVIALIMDRLATVSPGIAVDMDGHEPRYMFRSLREAAYQEDAGSELTRTQRSEVTLLSRPLESTQIHKSSHTQSGARALTQPEFIQPPELATGAPLNPSFTSSNPKLDPITETSGPLATGAKTKLDQFSEAAAKIADDDLRLDQLLIAAGKKHFKDWPFTLDAESVFRDRVEINIKWRGSLRKGIFKFGGGVEIHSMANSSLDDARPICEYDWQITIFRAYEPTMLPPPPDTPPTLLYWRPGELTDQERLAMKHLLVARAAGIQLFDAEQAKSVTAASEAEVAEIFARVYLKQGKLLRNNGTEVALNYQLSTFINTILTKLLDEPLTERYPQHPKFEELLDPDYVSEMASWMFASDTAPTPDQQMYLEQFARPLQLARFEGGKYQLDVREKEFPADSPISHLLGALEKEGAGPLSKPAAYQIVRREPFGLQRPALLLILAAFAAGNRITLVDEFGDPIHTETGLSPDTELADFSAICRAGMVQLQELSWKIKSKPITAAADYSDHTILIVDDEPDVHVVMEQAAKPLGCRVEKALDGVEALNKLQSTNVDLVISDLRMPNMTGIELFYQMQANPGLRDIPFIVLTSIETDEEDAAAALENGVEDYWLKPFRVQEITVRIKRLFRRRLTSTASYALAAWPDEPAKASEPALAAPLPKTPEVGEMVATQKGEEVEAVKIESTPGQAAKILPSPAVSRLPATGEKSPTSPLPPIPHPPIPRPPAPISESDSRFTIEALPGGPPPAPAAPQPAPPGEKADKLAIPSITAEFPALSDPQRQFEITDEESAKADEEKKAETSQEAIVVFCIKLSNPEATPIDIMLLYNQFWDSCRRVGSPFSTPEYEEFKSLVISKAKKLKKQFNCDELIFTVEIEGGAAHVDCQVDRMDDYLKRQPKFRLF